MAKSAFNDGNLSLGILGTRVLASFFNKIFNHRHDGKDEDGSAPIDYAVDIGTVANQFIINLVPPLAAHVPGLPIYFTAAQTNSAAATIAVGGLAPAAITKNGGIPLTANDIIGGTIYLVVWDGAEYQLVGKDVGKSWVPVATGSVVLPVSEGQYINLRAAGHKFYRMSAYATAGLVIKQVFDLGLTGVIFATIYQNQAGSIDTLYIVNMSGIPTTVFYQVEVWE